MKNVLLTVPDSKFNNFIKLINELGYVKILEKGTTNEMLDINQEILDNRLVEHYKNPTQGIEWKELKKK